MQEGIQVQAKAAVHCRQGDVVGSRTLSKSVRGCETTEIPKFGSLLCCLARFVTYISLALDY